MNNKKVYLVGIKGIAMTAMAVYLKEKGYRVTGSDVRDIFPTDQILNKYKIKIRTGFDKKNIDKKYDLLIATGAHGGKTNPEVLFAQTVGIPVMMHGQAIGLFMQDKIGISVAGCHGKTTTSSIISFLLSKAGFDPSYAIGTSVINNLGPGGHFGSGRYFVAEADEYMTCPLTDPTPRFLWQNPSILVVTNIEFDHPDAYIDIEKVKEAFRELILKVPSKGTVIACADDENIRQVINRMNRKIITYGFSPRSDFVIKNHSFGEGISFMRIGSYQIDFGEFILKIPGKHNMLNALASVIVANQIGLEWEKIKDILKFYSGCSRRFEKISEFGQVLLYDDYAHHPSEIEATISAAKYWYTKRRIVIIFQPHTYSRTKSLFREFAKSFIGCDIAIICDIYPSAREQFDSTISSKQLVSEANRYKKNAKYLKNKESVIAYLSEIVRSQDLIITMGAGDIYTWKDDLIRILRNKFL